MPHLKDGFERFDDAGRAVNAAIRTSVSERPPVDARERESLLTFLSAFDALIDSGVQPTDEHASPTHVTASAIVTSQAGVLLHLHKRLAMWLQPGGHIDAGEMPWEAARRETLEETGLGMPDGIESTRLVHVDVHPGPRGHTHLDLRYHFASPPAQPAPPEGESQEVRWFSWADAIDIAEAGLEGCLRSMQPGQPVIRPAVLADAPKCAHVYVRSKAFALPEVPEPHTEPEIAKWMTDVAIPGMDVWVAAVDGVVVGQMMLAPGWLHHLYIDPSWMGRGLGDQFMAIARQRQPDGVQLWAFQSNTRGRRFYEHHGFTAVEFTDGSANEEHWPDVRYA
jgi:8-oxo-dGTP pyrophosphatase MutT (NUDIX family)/ribosomal protein S18 acetylase RimI-like enzyme